MKKFEIVETPDYILAVSDEEVKEGDIGLSKLNEIIVFSKKYDSKLYKKIIAHLPKGNAPELDLPLLPEMVVEDDVERLAEKYVDSRFNVNSGTIFTFERLHRETFIAGYKAAAKVYSEEDLRKAIEMAREESGLSDNTMCYDYDEDEIIQSLKQPKTPKWFVAETKQKFQPDKNKRTDVKNGVYYELKTETNSEGKQVLKGHYL